MVQLPVPPPAALAATGNVPLAAGCLAVSARVHGLDRRLRIEVVEPQVTDSLGDTLLADHVECDEPDFVGFSLYLWNCERSLHLAREVKRRSPRTRVLIGGPEVGPDNRFVLKQSGFDVAVTGEAEDTFAQLLGALLDGRDPHGLPGIAVRRPLGLSAFGPQPAASFPLSAYPSPYLEDLVPVDPSRSTYVETVRGCRSHCTFCFYPRSSSVLRTLDVPQSAALVAALRSKGAREIVFLDPTFNHRPGFEPLLEALRRENAEKTLTFFAEVRAEGLTPQHARMLKDAGFDRLEIGLQSVNRETLKRVRRGGSPEKVAEAARMLHGEGIELLVDLIVGLPGDTPDDVLRGMDFLDANGLADEAQVFPLSLLPGTAMRATAFDDGVVYDPAPPYRVQRTATFSPQALLETVKQAEERLGRRLDEWPRPHLIDGGLDGFEPEHRSGAQHVALWFRGADLFVLVRLQRAQRRLLDRRCFLCRQQRQQRCSHCEHRRNGSIHRGAGENNVPRVERRRLPLGVTHLTPEFVRRVVEDVDVVHIVETEQTGPAVDARELREAKSVGKLVQQNREEIDVAAGFAVEAEVPTSPAQARRIAVQS